MNCVCHIHFFCVLRKKTKQFRFNFFMLLTCFCCVYRSRSSLVLLGGAAFIFSYFFICSRLAKLFCFVSCVYFSSTPSSCAHCHPRISIETFCFYLNSSPYFAVRLNSLSISKFCLYFRHLLFSCVLCSVCLAVKKTVSFDV